MGYKRVIVDGKSLNERTAKMLACAEARLDQNLYITQGSYNSGTEQSAGTHDGGGAIDVTGVNNWNEVVLALREVGFAAWHRTPTQGDWVDHIHAIAIEDAELSSGAKSQVYSYYNGNNGLAYNGTDDGPRLNPIPVWKIKFPNVWVNVVNRQFKSKNPKSKVSVERFQRALNRRLSIDITVDGVAGKETRNAFKRYQKKNNIDVDGIPKKNSIKKVCAGFNRVL